METDVVAAAADNHVEGGASKAKVRHAQDNGQGQKPVECATRRKKSWSELRQIVRESRRAFITGTLSTSASSNSSASATSTVSPLRCTPSNFIFRHLKTLSKTRIYFLSSLQSGKESTLLYTDLDDVSGPSHVPPSAVTPLLAWHALIEASFQSTSVLGHKVSKEEQLLWERKRTGLTWGITHFELHAESGRLVFPAASSLFFCTDNEKGSGQLFPHELKTATCNGARLNATMCPANPQLVAFVANGDLWLTHTATGQEVRLTHCHNGGFQSLADDPLSAGLPSYVMQEEFNRFTGFWWRPTKDNAYTILYEEVDEGDVDLLKLPMGHVGEVEEFRFPRAGGANARSTLKCLRISVDDSDEIGDVVLKELQVPLQHLFPWAEYIARVGWTPDGENIWLQLVDRRQQLLQLVLIPQDAFESSGFSAQSYANSMSPTSSFELSNGSCSSQRIQVLLSQKSDAYVLATDILSFVASDEPDCTSFIWASEESGFRHLYLVTAHLHPAAVEAALEAESPLKPRTLRKTALTSGEWCVADRAVFVDEARKLVYFHAFKDTPLEKHLYVVSLNQPGCVRRITEAGFSHSVQMNKDCSLFVTVFSSIQTVPSCQVFRIGHSDSTVEGVVIAPLGYLSEPRGTDKDYTHPELFSRVISSGDKLYGMIFKPPQMIYGQKYPVVLSVYGGPEVQLVSNTFKGVPQLRNHLLASQGYCVVCIDSRGSQNRGTAFESHLRLRMGQVELADQVEVLEWLATATGYMDMTKVAIHGWSYGGYLALMALVKFPHVFKVAIAGAPVTSWLNYDTGYTERYMDIPSLNPNGYRLGSILNYVNDFPDEENRLLIVHGLMDENVHFFQHTSPLISQLVRQGKPYQLQIYPGERHSLRHLEASEHYETMLLLFLQSHL